MLAFCLHLFFVLSWLPLSYQIPNSTKCLLWYNLIAPSFCCCLSFKRLPLHMFYAQPIRLYMFVGTTAHIPCNIMSNKIRYMSILSWNFMKNSFTLKCVACKADIYLKKNICKLVEIHFPLGKHEKRKAH